MGEERSHPELVVQEAVVAAVEGHGRSRHYKMAEGYRIAAEYLIEAAKDRGVRDKLIYPIIFNYRHHLELVLKAILIDRTIEQPKGYGHALLPLWRLVKEVLEKTNFERESVQLVEDIVVAMDDIDEMGINFRYAFQRDGMQINMEGRNFDLLAMKKAFDDLDTVLFAWDGD